MWSNLNKKKDGRYRIFVGSLIVVHLGFLAVFPSITSYALNKTSIKNVAVVPEDNYNIGEDTKEAMVSVSEDGYTFKIDKVKLDSKSLIITGSISGPELQYKDDEVTADVEIVPKDFTDGSTADGGGNRFNGEGDTFIFRVEERYKQGVVEKFLEKNQGYITLDVMVYKRNDIEGKTVARRVEEGDEEKRDYRVYWKENDKAIKEFKSIKVKYTYSAYTNKEVGLEYDTQ